MSRVRETLDAALARFRANGVGEWPEVITIAAKEIHKPEVTHWAHDRGVVVIFGDPFQGKVETIIPDFG